MTAVQFYRRADGLVIRSVADEALVYDQATGRTHALDGYTAALLDLCDGTRSVADVASALPPAGGGIADPVRSVDDRVTALVDVGLLVPVAASGTGSVSRRAVLARLSAGAAAAAWLPPLVETIVNPTAAAAQSGPNPCTTCSISGNTVANPGFEDDVVVSGCFVTAVNSWTFANCRTYLYSCIPVGDQLPGGGSNFLSIFEGFDAYVTQAVTLPGSCASAIDAGRLVWAASGYLGTTSSSSTDLVLQLTFRDSSDSPISTVTVGQAAPGAGWVLASDSDVVPTGARSVVVRVGNPPGNTAGGGADLISLTFTCT